MSIWNRLVDLGPLNAAEEARELKLLGTAFVLCSIGFVVCTFLETRNLGIIFAAGAGAFLMFWLKVFFERGRKEMPAPGTSEYWQEVQRRLKGITSIFALGVLGIAVSLWLIRSGIPQSEPAQQVTVTLSFASAGLTFLAIWSASILGLTVWISTKMEERRRKRKDR